MKKKLSYLLSSAVIACVIFFRDETLACIALLVDALSVLDKDEWLKVLPIPISVMLALTVVTRNHSLAIQREDRKLKIEKAEKLYINLRIYVNILNKMLELHGDEGYVLHKIHPIQESERILFMDKRERIKSEFREVIIEISMLSKLYFKNESIPFSLNDIDNIPIVLKDFEGHGPISRYDSYVPESIRYINDIRDKLYCVCDDLFSKIGTT